MNKLILTTLPIIAVLALSISGCGAPALEPSPTASPPPPTPTPRPTPTPTATPLPPTPTPEIMEPNYTNPTLGLSLWYPEHWVYDVQPEGVFFATSEQLIVGDQFESGAAMGLIGAELEAAQTVEEYFQMTLDQLYFEGMETSEPRARTIGGQPGMIVTFEGTPEGREPRLRGFIAVGRSQNRGYLFMGVSLAEQWPEYESTLQDMLRSVQFQETEHIYVSEELRLTMWYPEDWIYETDREQITFATSEDVPRSGDLETGAAMLVRTSPLREASLEEWFKSAVAERKFRNGGPTAKVKPCMIGGRDGRILTFEGSPTGSQIIVQGFMAATEDGEWGYFFLGVSVASEWSEYGPMLQEMLDSVQFME